MYRTSFSSLRRTMLIVALVCGFSQGAAQAYVDLAPTLSKIISDAKKIVVVEVVDFDREKHTITLKELRPLKGESSSETIRHSVASSTDGAIPLQISQWAEPGAQAVLFASRNSALVCVGHGWYQARSSDGSWKLGADRPDLPLAFYGNVSRLASGIERMLAGKDAVLTAVSYGAENVETSIDLALNRTNMPGLVKLERIRANLQMPAMVMAASANPAYVIGQGAADETDLPALVEQMKSKDANIRAEAADDVGSLRAKAPSAVVALKPLLSDTSARVRFAAAAALLRIQPSQTDALKVLSTGLNSSDPTIRRDAVEATGLVGPAGASLVARLAELLRDADESNRVAALQAIATLGPVAADAASAVKELLDNPKLAIDAADALGRIGPAARPIPDRIVKMLSSDQPAVRWAAVRAMSQIGSEQAHPAVEFMIKELPRAAEVEAYNMMVFLALLGPDAKDAVGAINNTRVMMNPMLRPATLWAIDSERNFPWQAGGRSGPPGGMGGDGPDLAKYIYEAYFHELGDRLRPTVKKLAEKIADGTAGNIPLWGYRLLSSAPDESLKILTPHLQSDDIVKRERAAVALGYMGAAAQGAKDQVSAAVIKASSEREKKLLEWCAREIRND